MNRQKTKQLPILTLFAVALAFGYQAINARHSNWVGLQRIWKDSTLEFGSKQKRYAAISIPGENHSTGVDFIDSGTEKMAKLGYLIKFKLGFLLDWLIPSQQGQYASYILRTEIPFQYPGYARVIGDKYKTIIDEFRRQVEGAGAHLVVLPIPTKLSVHREWAPAQLPMHELWKPSKLTREELAQAEDATVSYKTIIRGNEDISVDLLGLFREYARRNPSKAPDFEQSLYGLTESHWTSLGISLAAQGVIKNLIARSWPLELKTPVRKSSRPVALDADLITAQQLPKSFVKKHAPFQWTEPLYDWRQKAAAPAGGRLITLGSSYCKQLSKTAYGLPALLQKATGRALVDACLHGAGFMGSIHELHKKSFQFKKGDLVVWEFPIRFVPGDVDKVPVFVGPKPERL